MEENKETKQNKPQAVVEIIDCGPLRISGNFRIKDLKRDTEDAPGEIWLCRCGRSTHKPFCDEAHKK